MKNSKVKSIIVFAHCLFLITGCKDDSPTGTTTPESATISGTITFSGDWPSSDYVYVSINPTWPPEEAPEASKRILETDVSNNTYSYTFDNISFGTYGSITVSWLNITNTDHTTNQHTLGAYGGSTAPCFMDALSVTVSTTEYALTGKDFIADLTLTSAICSQ